jgi:hypothetical protein
MPFMIHKRKLSFLIYSILVIAFLIAVQSCHKQGARNSTSEKKSVVPKVYSLWKGDLFGCKKDRTTTGAREIEKDMSIKQPTFDDAVVLLGSPNRRADRQGNIVAHYYFNGFCNDGMFLDSLDYCWLELEFSGEEMKYFRGNVSCI